MSEYSTEALKEHPHGDPRENPRSGLAWIVIGVLGAFCMIVFGNRILMSLSRVRFGGTSTYQGLVNYQRIFANKALPSALANTVGFILVRTVLSFGAGILGAALGRGSRITGKAIVAALGLLIAFIPEISWLNLATYAHLAPEIQLRRFIAVLIYALPGTGMALSLGALLTCVWPRSPWRAGLSAMLLGLSLSVIAFGPSYIRLNYVPARGATALDDYIYMQGLQMGDLGPGAAAEVLRGLLNIIPFLLGTLFVAILWGGSAVKPARITAPRKRFCACLFAALIALALSFTAAACFLSLGGSSSSQSAGLYMANSLLLMLLTVVLGTPLYFGMLLCTGKLKNRSSITFLALMLVLASLSAFSVIKYYLVVKIGLANHYLSVCLRALFNPFSVLLLAAMILMRPRSAVTCLILAGGAALIAAVYAGGSPIDIGLYITRSQSYPLSTGIYVEMMSGAGTGSYLSLNGYLLLLNAFPLAGGIFLTVSGYLREFSPEDPEA